MKDKGLELQSDGSVKKCTPEDPKVYIRKWNYSWCNYDQSLKKAEEKNRQEPKSQT